MDEILYTGSRPKGGAPSRDELLDRAELLRRKWEGLSYRASTFFAGKRLKPGVFLLCALLIGALTTFATVYTRGYVVAVDGQELGVIADTAQVDAIVSKVEDRAGAILHQEDYKLACDITYTPKIVDRSKLTTVAGFETYLFNQVGEVMKTYTLTINGKSMGTLESREGLDKLLDSLKAPYINENTIISEFTVPVHITYDYTGGDELVSLSSIREVLTSNAMEKMTYTVVAGDTYSGIAYEHDMTLSELMDMNPQASLDSLLIGDELTVQQSVPWLSVRTVDRVTYEEAVPSPVEYIDDDSMYQGYTRVVEEGTEGLARITARITYINGVEDKRDVTQTQQLVAPTTRVVAQGTVPRPRTMPTGTYAWPVYGVITSQFGYRSIFGSYSYHAGLDIGVPYGTTIRASDGGTVTYAGWMDGYGYVVYISHGDGIATRYAHNSSLLVYAGEKVYQGQPIALAGSTGNSTGNHCHFEIRIGGTAVNPLYYLP